MLKIWVTTDERLHPPRHQNSLRIATARWRGSRFQQAPKGWVWHSTLDTSMVYEGLVRGWQMELC